MTKENGLCRTAEVITISTICDYMCRTCRQVLLVGAWVVLLTTLGAQEASPTSVSRDLLNQRAAVEIHIDESCRISEVISSSGSVKEHVYKDKSVCSVGRDKTTKREVVDSSLGHQTRRTVTIREHTFALHDSGLDRVTFVVDQKVPVGWQIDSDPQPNKIIAGMATFLVDVEPGQTVNLHVGERNPPAVSGEQPVPTAVETKFTPPPNIAGKSAWIPLRYQREETNLCVPTSASIILDYLGDEINPREIKELSLGRKYSPNEPFNDFTVTLFRDLVSGLRRLGYSWEEVDYPNNLNGFWRGIADIDHSLDRGIPVMVDTTTDRGRTFVVAGYSLSQQSLYVIDPSLPAPGMRTVDFQELENIWNSSSVDFNKRAAVFPQRKRVRN